MRLLPKLLCTKYRVGMPSSTYSTQYRLLSRPFQGGSNKVYEIKSEDGTRWCLRIPLDADAASGTVRGTDTLEQGKEKIPNLLAPNVVLSTSRPALATAGLGLHESAGLKRTRPATWRHSD